ncbi:hypothetical protein [Streptomyces gelaticus]|nr:hypothetical protein [Streptomyces gelaticus]
MQAQDRGFTAAFVSAFPRAIDFATDREQALGKVAELARRARAGGKLRPDFLLVQAGISATSASKMGSPVSGAGTAAG